MQLNIKLSTPKGKLIIWSREITALAMRSRLLSQKYPGTSIIHKLHSYPKMNDLFLQKRRHLFTSHVHSLLSPTAKTTMKLLNTADAFCSKCCQAGQGLGWDHWTRTGHWKQVPPAGYTGSFWLTGLLMFWWEILLGKSHKAGTHKIKPFHPSKDKKLLY